MARKDILRLVAGFRRFRERYYLGASSLYDRLSSSGQSPKTLIIGCSDSRVDPALISSASPGELFVVRNVANLVPPCESTTGFHGVSSAIEFAVVNLKVEHVVVLGHRQCGGIRALMSGTAKVQTSFIGSWIEIAADAKERTLAKLPDADFETQCRHCEMEAVVTSIRNLKTFPFVQQAIAERGLLLIGIYFDLERGQLFECDEENGEFRQLDMDRPPSGAV